MVINTYMLGGGSESCPQSHKNLNVGVGFQPNPACLLARADTASLKCPTGAPDKVKLYVHEECNA